MMPQLPKDRKRLEHLEFDRLLCRSVQILTEHARQCLSEANGYLIKAQQELGEYELAHPDNARRISGVSPVKLNSAQLREQITLIEVAMNLVSEALDIPEMAIASDQMPSSIKCKNCSSEQKLSLKRPAAHEVKQFTENLLFAYLDHHKQIDQVIQTIKTKWRMERMVSIDRDILRLACTEAFYLTDVPVKVAINEAVELSHRFADERAAKFINGVLADISPLAEEFRLTGELKILEFAKSESEPESEPESESTIHEEDKAPA